MDGPERAPVQGGKTRTVRCREDLLQRLTSHRDLLRQRFHVAGLSVFGSAARDELRDSSDVDLLVEFETPATFDGYLDLKDYLESVLARPVDLVTLNAARPRLLPRIEDELVRVA
ncbi:MAG: nucleotidyltransferase family protein [Chloroflexota bacterium]